jgi:hypothetical protein
MKKIKSWLAVMAGILFILQTHAQTAKDPKRYYSEKWNFSVLKPVNWQWKENPNASILVSFTDKTGATIDVLIEEKINESNLESYFKRILSVLKDSEDTKVGKNGKATINGVSAHWVIHTDQNTNSQTIDYYFLQNGVGIIISSSSNTSAFNNYENTFRQTAESFRVEK